jgi:hypothetical protein
LDRLNSLPSRRPRARTLRRVGMGLDRERVPLECLGPRTSCSRRTACRVRWGRRGGAVSYSKAGWCDATATKRRASCQANEEARGMLHCFDIFCTVLSRVCRYHYNLSARVHTPRSTAHSTRPSSMGHMLDA